MVSIPNTRTHVHTHTHTWRVRVFPESVPVLYFNRHSRYYHIRFELLIVFVMDAGA